MNGAKRFYAKLLTQQGSSGPALDSDALAFLTAAGITDPVIKTAINNRVLAYKAAGVWSKLIWDYPFCGGTALSNSKNLINPASLPLTWSGSPTHSASGVTFNTTNFGTSGFRPSVSLPLYSKAAMIWFKGIAPDNSWLWGAYDGNMWGARVLTSGIVTGVGANDYHETAGGYVSAFRRFGQDINSSSVVKLYADGVESVAPWTPGPTQPNADTYVGGLGGIPGFLYTFTCDGWVQSNTTLTTAEHAAIDAAILAFQTALSRA